MRIKSLLFLLIFLMVLQPVVSSAQEGTKTTQAHKKKKHKRKQGKQAEQKKKELLQRTLKEKHFHLPDTAKHK